MKIEDLDLREAIDLLEITEMVMLDLLETTEMLVHHRHQQLICHLLQTLRADVVMTRKRRTITIERTT